MSDFTKLNIDISVMIGSLWCSDLWKVRYVCYIIVYCVHYGMIKNNKKLCRRRGTTRRIHAIR